MNNKNNYPFPLLSNQDLLFCLSQMGHEFTKEDIQHPQPNKIREICEAILESFSGYNKGQSQIPLDYAIDKLSDPSLYTQYETIGELSFLRAIANLMKVVGFDFTYKDIYKPDPNRTRSMLSGIINLGKFMQLKISKWTELSEENSQLMDERNYEKENEERLFIELEELRKKKMEKDQVIDSLKMQHQDEEQKLKKLIQIQNEQKKQLSIRQNHCETVQQNISSISKTIENTLEECGRMEALIVPSPEKIKKVLQDMKEKIQEKKASLKEFEPTMSKLQSKKKQLEKINKNIQETLDLIVVYQEENQLYKNVKKLTKKTNKEIEKHQERLDQSELELERYKNDISINDEKNSKNNELFQNKNTEFIKIESELRNQKAIIEKEREAIQIKIDSYNKELNQLRLQINHLKQSHEKEKISIQKSFYSLIDQIHNYHLDLYNLIESDQLQQQLNYHQQQQQQQQQEQLLLLQQQEQLLLQNNN